MHKQLITGNWTVIAATLALSLSCMINSADSLKADQKAAPPPLSSSDKLWSASESDLIGDWHTGDAEGWRVKLNPDHSTAIYSEGVIEGKPSFSTWKLINNRVIISDEAAFQMGNVKGYANELIAMRFRNRVVLLPAENLPLAEKYGLAPFFCFWRSGSKGSNGLPRDFVKLNNEAYKLIQKDIEKDKRKHD